MILNTMMEYAQAMFEAEVLCEVFVIIANACHVRKQFLMFIPYT